MVTLCVANAKGGTLKTTVAVHLAAGLARDGATVVLVDLDPQGNASTWLLGTIPDSPGAAAALVDQPLLEPLAVPGRPGLRLLHGGPALAVAQHQLTAEIGGETLLRRALRTLDADYAVLDCPPAVDLTVVAALVAADAVIVPVLPAFLSLAGLAQLEAVLRRVGDRLGATATLLGAVLVAADPREAVTGEIRTLLQAQRPGTLYTAEIRISTAAKALPAHQQTAWEPGADPRGALDYAALLTETQARLHHLSIYATSTLEV
jgi:chromosome partitioning protein